MGYRSLLKIYMSYVEDVVGSNLVELAELTETFSQRELGELRTIAAETHREAFNEKETTSAATIVHMMLVTGELQIEQLIALDHPEFTNDHPVSSRTRNLILQALARDSTPHS